MTNSRSVFVYNLELPGTRLADLTLDGYVFRPLEDYSERARRLQRLTVSPVNFGRNSVTVTVEPPDIEPSPILGFANSAATRLDDILLVLSLFTMRHVGRAADRDDVLLSVDHREYQFGHKVRAALPMKIVKDGSNWHDTGFAEGIQAVLNAMAKDEWSELYQGAHFLFIANHAFRRQILETSFLLCWTIWEHLFALHRRSDLSPREIRNTPGVEKIAYCLQQYGVRASLSEATGSAPIEELKNTRNNLVHLGKFPGPDLQIRAEAFIHWTEFLIAKILGLYTELPGWGSVEGFAEEVEKLRVLYEESEPPA